MTDTVFSTFMDCMCILHSLSLPFFPEQLLLDRHPAASKISCSLIAASWVGIFSGATFVCIRGLLAVMVESAEYGKQK